MKLQAAPRILAVAVICAASLIALVVSEGLARDAGQEVMLPMEAVDPRSLLQGHYVQLNLTQRLAPGQTCPAASEGEWVALRPHQENTYVAAGGADSREQAQLIGLPVKGAFICSRPTDAMPDVPAQPGSLTLDIGVDRFHINQTEAVRIEQVLRTLQADAPPRAFAIVSIGRDGRARLKGLLIDGERLELSWL